MARLRPTKRRRYSVCEACDKNIVPTLSQRASLVRAAVELDFLYWSFCRWFADEDTVDEMRTAANAVWRKAFQWR